MSTRLYGCVCGHLVSPRAAMGEASQETGRFPLPFYVIDHPRGVALFDCGLHLGMLDPDDDYRKALSSQSMRVEIKNQETTTARLEALDIDPLDVRLVILSHLHFDHVGGLHQIPNAEVIVQKREWRTGLDPEPAARNFFLKSYFDLGHKVRLVEGEHDVFGDGRVTCLPSYGHTPGHQSLRVHSDDGDHILTADACYFCRTVNSREFPAFADQARMGQSLDALLAQRAQDTIMVFGHDPDQWGQNAVLASLRS